MPATDSGRYTGIPMCECTPECFCDAGDCTCPDFSGPAVAPLPNPWAD